VVNNLKYVNKYIALLCSVLITCSIFAQQEFQFSQIHHFPVVLNPAFTGVKPGVNANVIYRTQWLGLTGAPQSQVLTIDLPIDYFNSGFGAIISNDVIGASRVSKVAILYSYKYRINSTSLISIGAQAGAFQYQLDGTELLTNDGLYENSIIHNDELVTNSLKKTIQPDVGLGLYFISQLFQTGLAVNNLINVNTNGGNTAESISFQAKPHYNFQLSTNFTVLDNISIKPALFLHSDLREHQLNIVLPGRIRRVEAALGYRGYSKRSNDALMLMAGFAVMKNFELHYAYFHHPKRK